MRSLGIFALQGGEVQLLLVVSASPQYNIGAVRENCSSSHALLVHVGNAGLQVDELSR